MIRLVKLESQMVPLLTQMWGSENPHALLVGV